MKGACESVGDQTRRQSELKLITLDEKEIVLEMSLVALFDPTCY